MMNEDVAKLLYNAIRLESGMANTLDLREDWASMSEKNKLMWGKILHQYEVQKAMYLQFGASGLDDLP